jgi:glyoxylase-like metal-dependent hydrolase (beta-lactamase superfamily II)
VHPTFPEAKYIIQRQEWEEALHTREITEHIYCEDDFIPLKDSARLRLVHGHYFVIPGISTWLTGGHTTGHQIIRISSKGDNLLFLGDIVPTRFHFDLKSTFSYDLFPLTTCSVKRHLIEDSIEDGWLFVLQHDPEVSVCRLVGTPDNFKVEEVEINK